MNPEGTKVISEPVLVFDGNDGVNHTVECPEILQTQWVLLYIRPCWWGGYRLATGTPLKECLWPLRSEEGDGEGSTDINGPHQGAWVETNSGESWFVHFQDKAMYGRVIHLNPVKWTEGWPVIGEDKDGDGCGEPVRRYRKPNVGKTYPVETPAESDEFNSRRLGLQWEWHANYQDAFGFTSDLGYMRIYGHVLSEDFVNFWEVPNLLLQKFPAE